MPNPSPASVAEQYVKVGNTQYPVSELLHYCHADPAIAGPCDKRMVEHLNEEIALAIKQTVQAQTARLRPWLKHNSGSIYPCVSNGCTCGLDTALAGLADAQEGPGGTMNAIVPTKDCQGCEDNFYNGNNPYGIAECWSVKTARIVSGKMLSVDQPWPDKWLQTAPKESHPNCYRMKRYIFVKDAQGGTGG